MDIIKIMNSYSSPKIQKFNIEGVKHISVLDAYEAIQKKEIYFLDVREHDENASEFFEFQNIYFFPMSVIMDKLEHLPVDIPIVVVCNDGMRSTKVANLLNRQAYKMVANLDGGIAEWKANKLPIIETGAKKESDACNPSSCGCSCSGCN